MNLENSAVLVTGASRGLGAALGAELARAGAQVVLSARDPLSLRATVEAITARGGRAHAVATDVGDARAAHALVATAAALVGPLDAVVHNASTLGPTPLRALLDTTPEDFERVLQVNLLGPFRISQALAGSMALRNHGVIAHVSSDAAVEAYPNWGAYAVSKAALDQLARMWAVELADFSVRVFSVDPGEMDTEMHAAAMPEADRSTLADPAQVAARIASMLAHAESIAPGARIVAERWRVPS